MVTTKNALNVNTLTSRERNRERQCAAGAEAIPTNTLSHDGASLRNNIRPKKIPGYCSRSLSLSLCDSQQAICLLGASPACASCCNIVVNGPIRCSQPMRSLRALLATTSCRCRARECVFVMCWRIFTPVPVPGVLIGNIRIHFQLNFMSMGFSGKFSAPNGPAEFAFERSFKGLPYLIYK